MDILEFALISMIPIPVFWYVFKIKLRFIPLGIGAMILSALVEMEYEKFLGDQNIILMVVFIAPVIEETIKMLFTWFGKDLRSGMGIGLGFAVVENIMYYMSYPFIFWNLFALREFQDPLLHTTSTGVSSGAWKRPWKYSVAIGIHMIYNIVALSNSFISISILAIAYLGILVFMKLKEKKIKMENKKIDGLKI